MNIDGMLSDIREIFAVFVPYIGSLCLIPQNYLVTHETSKSIITIINESTKEKVLLNEIEFDNVTEMVFIFDNEVSLTSIIENIVEILKWDPENHVIVATDGKKSFSYGVKYFCVKDTENNVVDICVKNNINSNYVPIICSESIIQREYNYFELIKTNKK